MTWAKQSQIIRQRSNFTLLVGETWSKLSPTIALDEKQYQSKVSPLRREQSECMQRGKVHTWCGLAKSYTDAEEIRLRLLFLNPMGWAAPSLYQYRELRREMKHCTTPSCLRSWRFAWKWLAAGDLHSTSSFPNFLQWVDVRCRSTVNIMQAAESVFCSLSFGGNERDRERQGENEVLCRCLTWVLAPWSRQILSFELSFS